MSAVQVPFVPLVNGGRRSNFEMSNDQVEATAIAATRSDQPTTNQETDVDCVDGCYCWFVIVCSTVDLLAKPSCCS